MTLIMLIPGSTAKDIDKSCETFVVFFFPNTAVTNWMISLISVNRLLALPRWNLAEKYYTWKLCGAYFVGFWIVSFILLAFPLTGVWGEVHYQPQTFSCTIDKGPLTFFSVIGKFEKKFKLVAKFFLVPQFIMFFSQLFNSKFGVVLQDAKLLF